MAFTATDDVGIERLELVVKLEEKGREAVEIVREVPLGADKGSPFLEKKVPLDLSKLPLKPGMKIYDEETFGPITTSTGSSGGRRPPAPHLRCPIASMPSRSPSRRRR